jgi:ATP-dependent Clp protease ATP-binding subunit ClpX
LRAILENCMLDVMFDIPGTETIKEVIITPECVSEQQQPVVVHETDTAAMAG